MANVAKYDREDVVNRAMQLFWRRGFNGTSTRDLQEAIDMRPGSIYAAFGSKEGLFKEALQHYSTTMGGLLQEKVTEQGSPLAGLQNYIRCVVIERRDTAPSDMCMLVKTVAEITETNPELLKQSQALMKKTELCFAGLLEQAQIEGEIPGHKDPLLLAKYLQVQLIGLRTYLRSSQDPEAVDTLICEIFTALKN